jgi:hypothetical protein
MTSSQYDTAEGVNTANIVLIHGEEESKAGASGGKGPHASINVGASEILK